MYWKVLEGLLLTIILANKASLVLWLCGPCFFFLKISGAGGGGREWAGASPLDPPQSWLQSSQVDLLAKSEMLDGMAVFFDTEGATPLG